MAEVQRRKKKSFSTSGNGYSTRPWATGGCPPYMFLNQRAGRPFCSQNRGESAWNIAVRNASKGRDFGTVDIADLAARYQEAKASGAQRLSEFIRNPARGGLRMAQPSGGRGGRKGSSGSSSGLGRFGGSSDFSSGLSGRGRYL